MQPRNNYRTIIDGYNLIFQCGLEGRSRNSRTIEKARDRLISTLAKQLDASARYQTAIVFDATTLPIKEVSQVSIQNEMTIIYAVDHDDADTLIEELVQKHSSPKQLVIVSSDHRLHKAALRRKATPIDSDVWLDQVETGEHNKPAAKSSDAGSSSADDSGENKEIPEGLANIDWAKEFGIDD